MSLPTCVSHNLRSPVANIQSLAMLMEMEEITPAHLKPYVNNIFDSALRLDDVITDLSKILSSKNSSIDLKQEMLDVRGVVNDISTDLAEKILHSGARIELKGSPLIYSHKTYIYSILYNFITNSIQFRSEDPLSIEISISQTEKLTTITFTDNSMGIDLSVYGNEIFKPYKGFHSTIKGKGLGLFLVHCYVEALQGSIKVKSEIDQGMFFIISLPK